jgi:hypothetical protein
MNNVLFQHMTPHTCFRNIEIGTIIEENESEKFSQDVLLQWLDDKITKQSRQTILGGHNELKLTKQKKSEKLSNKNSIHSYRQKSKKIRNKKTKSKNKSKNKSKRKKDNKISLKK